MIYPSLKEQTHKYFIRHLRNIRSNKEITKKIKVANTRKDNRIIRIYDSTYKMIIKIISNILKFIIRNIIGSCQLSYLKSRQAMDNAIGATRYHHN